MKKKKKSEVPTTVKHDPYRKNDLFDKSLSIN